MDYFKKKFAVRGNRGNSEAGSSKTLARPSTLSVDSQTKSTTSQPVKSSRPMLSRASSEPGVTRQALAAEQSDIPRYPALLPYTSSPSPPTPSQPVERPIILRMTKGPSQLRSNFPKRVPEPVRPKTSRRSIAAPPQFGSKTASLPTSASMPALSELVSSPSATSITIIPPSPSSATLDASVDDTTPSAQVDVSPQSSSTGLPVSTPALEQEILFPAHPIAALPSPTSDFGGELYTPSPSLGCFALPEYPARRPVADSCIPEETGSDGSPDSIRSRMERESAEIVMVTGRLAKLPSRAVLREFNSQRPITLDLSSATRKPNHMRQVSAGPSIMAGPSGVPMSPNYARPLPLESLSPLSTPRANRTRAQGLEVDVEEEEINEQATPPSRRDPFQAALDFLAKQAREEGVESGLDASAVGAAH